ncbi:Ubiquitin-like protein 7 [Papilio machaon]|uniref:Ubiquitin-like protein 7 n=1 Tax=Papilio machaon TaxID=76193 RepID=A0A194RPD0_PAPMA|nr:ubiquitin-like protein 7 [Papilio machaon]KPJ19367.1 Ubiquitin-like protein 7 [Papilio machaon]
MEPSENQSYVFLGVKVKPGPIERYKLDNFTLENKVINLKAEAEKRVREPSSSLEAIHHGKILRDDATLQDCGIKYGEMVHVVKKKIPVKSPPAPTFSDAELQQLNTSLRTLGCTPNAPGWTRAMQLLNDEATLAEVVDQLPSLNEDCVALSILHEVELLAALGANVETMRRGADAHPDLPAALRHLTRLVRSRNTASNENVPTSGFAYSLEALSEDEDVEEEETEEGSGERNTITREQLTAALQAATEAAFSTNTSNARESRENLIRILDAAADSRGTARSASTTEASTPSGSGAPPIITTEMFNEAMTEAMSRAGEQSTAAPETSFATSSQNQGNYATQISHMHEMGLMDDALNIRALVICSGDVNAAINLVFSGAIGDD